MFVKQMAYVFKGLIDKAYKKRGIETNTSALYEDSQGNECQLTPTENDCSAWVEVRKDGTVVVRIMQEVLYRGSTFLRMLDNIEIEVQQIGFRFVDHGYQGDFYQMTFIPEE